MSFDSESGHWYDREAKSAYTTNNRPTTLRDARKLNLVPVCDHCAECPGQKPALTNWLVTQASLAALTGTRREGESDTVYIARVLADSKKQVIDAANEGSRIHDAIRTLVPGNVCTGAILAACRSQQGLPS